MPLSLPLSLPSPLPPPRPSPRSRAPAPRPAPPGVEAILAELRARRAGLARAPGGGGDAARAVLADLDALIDWALALREGEGGDEDGGARPAEAGAAVA